MHLKMKKLYIALVGTCLLVCCFQTVMAQVGKYEKANKAYGQWAYLDASEIYRHVAENGVHPAHLLQTLGHALHGEEKYVSCSGWDGGFTSFILQTQIL